LQRGSQVGDCPHKVGLGRVDFLFDIKIRNGARPVNPDNYKSSAIADASFWERLVEILDYKSPKGCIGTIPNFVEFGRPKYPLCV
jgi:hypothetical protein